MSPLKYAILEAIDRNDGKYTWYQLDRALTQRADMDPGVVSRELMPALRELEQAHLITASPGSNPGQPLYSVTPAGQETLEVLCQVHKEVIG